MKTRIVTWLAMMASACLFASSAHAAEPWQTLKGCRLVESASNDGDNFRVRWKEKEFTVRIYFVDALEVYTSQRDLIKAQASYFGIPVGQAVAAGKMAREFTRKHLQGGFNVKTRWQGVFGGKDAARKYGLVSVGGEDLAELLVANGLARIQGMGIEGQTQAEVARLRQLEKRAKAGKRGAWGME